MSKTKTPQYFHPNGIVVVKTGRVGYRTVKKQVGHRFVDSTETIYEVVPYNENFGSDPLWIELDQLYLITEASNEQTQ